METHPDVLEHGIKRASGEITPFNAGDAVGAAVDVCREMGFPVAPQVKARLGKGAKALTEAGFKPKTVILAMVTAIRTGWIGSVETIAQEIVVAEAGQSMGREEYRQSLAAFSHQVAKSDSPIWQTMREEMARRAAKKEIE